MRSGVRRRGEPLVALSAVVAGWVAVRAAILAIPGAAAIEQPDEMQAFSATVAVAPDSPPAATVAQSDSIDPAGLTPNPIPDLPRVLRLESTASPLSPIAVPLAPAPSAAPAARAARAAPAPSVRMAAGHQLLYAAAFANLPLPIAAVPVPRGTAAGSIAPERKQRWSGDAWLLLRPDYRGVGAAPFPVYGASQAGAVVRYRLALASVHQPMAYLRVNAAIATPRERDVAAGLSLRPVGRIPVRLAGEMRASQNGSRTSLRPAAYIVSELPAVGLPLGLRAELYGQAGYVGGGGATAFVDAQVRVDRRLAALGSAELRGGGGVWGGAQQGAGRLDVGPGLTLGLPFGAARARLSADWRFRIAGQAAPASGPAITLSAGF